MKARTKQFDSNSQYKDSAAACAYYSISHNTLEKLAEQADARIKIGKAKRYHIAKIDSFLEENKEVVF